MHRHNLLSDIYKTDIYKICERINKDEEIIPVSTMTKPPSAELRPNQKDTDSLPDYSFLDKVIFIKPEVDEKLARLNKLLHEKFLPHFEPGDNRNYLPENWYPHIALGVKLSHEQFEEGMKFLTAQGIGGAPQALRSNGGESRNLGSDGVSRQNASNAAL